MNLFNKDKEFVFKALNAVLVIWFIGAVIVLGTNMVDLYMKPEKLTYEEYKTINCTIKDGAHTDDECLQLYNQENIYNKNDDHYKKVSVAGSIINILVVGTTTIILNKKKND